MKQDKEFNNILDECLERLLVGGETLEQCLQRYPEQASELEPLLETALIIKEASAVQPRAEFKAMASYQFRSALQEAVSLKERRLFGWLPQWATAVVIFLILLLAGGGVVAAAAGSMPDSPLYPVKLATEEVQLMLTPSELGRAELCASFADRRVAEIIYMADRGDAHQVELITQRLNEGLGMLAVLAGAPVEGVSEMLLAPLVTDEGVEGGRDAQGWDDDWAQLRETVANAAAVHPAELREALERVPEAVRLAMLRAIAVSEAGYQNVLDALD